MDTIILRPTADGVQDPMTAQDVHDTNDPVRAVLAIVSLLYLEEVFLFVTNLLIA
jgi:hypothetical protein